MYHNIFTNATRCQNLMHQIAAAPCLGKISSLPKKKFFSGQGEMKVVLKEQRYLLLHFFIYCSLYFTFY